MAGALSSWKRVNEAPNPDLGVLDALLGSGEAGSGTSWLLAQMNATALKEVSGACSVMHTQLQTVNLPAISWKPFGVSSKNPSGKYELVIDGQAQTEHLLTEDTWQKVVDGVQHVCMGINTFATSREKREQAKQDKAQKS